MKKKTHKIILAFVFTSFLVSCNNTVEDNRNGVRIKKCNDCLVEKQETAIRIAEAILFERYSKDKIEDQKPYIVKIEKDSIWVIDGTFNKIGYGGTFHIEISSKNGKIIKVFHYK